MLAAEKRLFPARVWIEKVDARSLRADAFAGFSKAAIVLRQGVAFATIAGPPPEMGLSTAMIAAAIAAFWGSSMVMISGPTTAISAVVFATLEDLAPSGSPRFIELALLLTILVGLVQVLFRSCSGLGWDGEDGRACLFGLAFGDDRLNGGVAMVGEVRAALPSLAPPGLHSGDDAALRPGAFAVALVGLLAAISIARAFAIKRRERFDANQGIVGQGLSNAVGGFFQCHAGSGPLARSGVNAMEGAATPPLGHLFMPLSGRSAAGLCRLHPVHPGPGHGRPDPQYGVAADRFRRGARVIGTIRPETPILVATLLAVLLVEPGFVIDMGVIASFAVFIHESSHPAIRVGTPVVTASGPRKFRNAHRS